MVTCPSFAAGSARVSPIRALPAAKGNFKTSAGMQAK